MKNDEMISFKYHFTFDLGERLDFDVQLDPETLDIIHDVRPELLPAWTERRFHQCPCCTLEGPDHTHCPIAVEIIGLIKAFNGHVSHEPVHVVVEAPERTYAHRVPLQYGVSSLLGIYMTTSGCPVMEKLKPMVRFHLPFATLEETTYRHISMYLTAQFLRSQKGLPADWTLEHLLAVYEDIHILNKYFCKRITAETTKDASLNAVVILSNFADYIPFNITDAEIGNLATLFRSYLSPVS